MIFLYFVLGWLLFGVIATFIVMYSEKNSLKTVKIIDLLGSILFGLISFFIVASKGIKDITIKNPFYKE